MKRYLVMLCLCATTRMAYCQYIDNTLDLTVSVYSEAPKGIKTNDGLPTIFANYESTYGFMIGTQYKVNRVVGIGLNYLQTSFTSNAVESFPSVMNPKSLVKNLLITANFTWGRRLEIGGNISVGPSFHKLIIQQLIIPAEQPVMTNQKNFRETELSVMPGLSISFHLSNEIKSTFGVSYKYMTANNLLYADHDFQSLIVSLGITKKLLKNTLFQYD